MTEPKVRKRTRLKSGGHDPHRSVGYKNPPRATQFAKGQSGNPKGRPKKRSSPLQSIRDMLDEPVMVREADGVKEISTFAAFLKRLKKAALEGDPKATQAFIKLVQLAGLEGPKDETAGAASQSAADAAFLKELAALIGEDDT